jgi:hypothetical protein
VSTLPVGAELAVAQHIEDLLTSDRGQELLEAEARPDDEQAHVRAVRELAAWLAHELIGALR